MTRKSDLNLKLSVPSALHEYVEWQREITPSEGRKGDIVSIIPVSCSDIAKQQLDPRQITIQYLIENGVQIQPGLVQDVFKISDPADVQRLSESVSAKVFDFLVKNEPNYNFDTNRFESVES